jgi:hypothetical protein
MTMDFSCSIFMDGITDENDITVMFFFGLAIEI